MCRNCSRLVVLRGSVQKGFSLTGLRILLPLLLVKVVWASPPLQVIWVLFVIILYITALIFLNDDLTLLFRFFFFFCNGLF